jgi:2-polyprenyl-3-methyl-5-hydroxy-6-metoxy-1,4-benzoquinol methylase
VRLVFTELYEKGIDFPRHRALDFGCGYGRLTQSLAILFENVIGVDVAPSMIAGAREHNRHGDRVSYVLNERPDLTVLGDQQFDFIQTAIVLQHMRPEYQNSYLREFVRVLRPGGVIVAHIPVCRCDGSEIDYTWQEQEGEKRVEMHGQPIAAVERVFTDAGAEVLHSVPDQWAGGAWESAHYIVRRPRSARPAAP